MSHPAPDPAFEALLEFLKRSRALDFTGYKRTSLERRVHRRMEIVGCESFGDYLDYLEVHPGEYELLFDTLLINVTEFFRDPPVWEHVRDEVVPKLVQGGGDGSIRVWSAGCASGQEAYSIAMLLADALGPRAFRERVKIYATDIDEDALATARLGVYSVKDAESVPPALRGRYFEQEDDRRVAFRGDLRRNLIFGRNNLVAAAPISRLDLLLCRNTLIYFTTETQARTRRHFPFALAGGGALVLGKSEMMVSHRDLFEPVDLRKRIFRRQAQRRSLQARVSALASGEIPEPARPEDEQEARDAALALGSDAQLIVSRAGVLSFANLAARALFRVSEQDIGRPFADLPLARHPADMPAAVERALRERRRIALGEVGYTPERGDERRLDVSVAPLLADSSTPHATLVTYADVTGYATLRGELESTRRDLQLAYEELQSTIDELETTNEELQSANEELQTTNEELQSTNEELETMNEELQSTNEELETINDELRDRTGELNQVNEFLETILSSLGVGVVVLDAHQQVQVWSQRAEDVWGLRDDEALDRHFLALDIGLPTEQLAPALQAVLAGSPAERAELEAVNRRGRQILCSVRVLPLQGLPALNGDAPRGAVLLVEDRPLGAGPGEPPAAPQRD